MKKIALISALLALSHLAFALPPVAGLRLKNHPSCTVYVVMYAIDANLSNPSACDIATFTITVPPGTLSYIDPVAAMSAWGYCTTTTAFSPATLYAEIYGASPSWVWTDASFQYSCPDCGVGGCLSESFSGCSGNCLMGCGTSWTAGNCTPAANSATWTSAGACTMNNVQIDFY